MALKWKCSREYLLAQLVRLVEQYIDSGRVIDPPLFNEDDKRRRIVITLNMTKVVQHLCEAIRFENALTLEPVFCGSPPLRKEPRKNGAPASGVFGLRGRARTPGAPHQYVRLRFPFMTAVGKRMNRL